MTAVNRIDILDDLYVEDSNNIDVSHLASLLAIHQKDLAEAFAVTASSASRSGISPDNTTMKQWMRIFNLVIDLIESSTPSTDKAAIQLKMSRYLKLPNSHFAGKSLLDRMMHGQSRKVIRFLEQLDS